MAQINRSNAERSKSQDQSDATEGRHWLSGKQLPAVCAGVFMVALFFGVSSCSRKSDKPVSVAQSQPAAAPAASSPAPSLASAPEANPTASKKAKKPRRTTATYVNGDYGVSFRYPKKYSLKVGDEAQLAWPGLGPVQMDFVKAGGVTLAAVELPDSSYPETDFASAFFNMSVNLGLTASECEQLTPQASSGEAPAAKVKLGGIEFYEKENVNQEELKQADTRYYHSFQNGMCYEFALGVGTARDGADDQTPQVDRTEVFRKLEKILATVQIKSVAVPAPAAPVNSQESTPQPSPDTPLDVPVTPSKT